MLSVSGTSQLVGVVLLLHSAFSAWENAGGTVKTMGRGPSIPSDIRIEALVGALLIILAGTVSAVSGLRPKLLSEEYALAEARGENPYMYLETRPSFQDLVARRDHYLQWRRESSKAKRE